VEPVSPARESTRTVIRVDVSDVAPAGCRELALEVVEPAVTPPRAVLFCFPGGGMTRRYFDLAAPGYSFAEYARARGFLVVMLDHPGTGDSDGPDDGWTLTPAVVAGLEAAAVDRARTLLGADGIPAIGVAHSAGAHLLIHQFGRDPRDNSKVNGISGPNGPACPRTSEAVSGTRFAGLALLGWAGHGLPEYLDAADRRLAELAASDPEAFPQELVAGARRKFGRPFPVLDGHGSSLLIRNPMPDHARQALSAAGAPLLAVVGHASMIPGSASRAAAAVDVPVFLGVGEHDIATSHHLIPAQFPASPDVTLYVLPGAGHNHNVEPGREELWDRVTRWAGQLASSVK
jgi:alpha-beta hydrolase superfamily lysophospholipase